MKANRLTYACAMLLLMAGCNRSPREEIVCETYVHRYGMPMPAEEWSERGEDGQVTSILSDGVTVTKSYEGGVLHGETLYSFPHKSLIQRKEIYNSGVLGQEMHYQPGGVPCKQIVYNSPVNKTVVTWYDNGSPQSKEDYEQDLLVNGEYLTYNNVHEAFITNYKGTRVVRDQYGDMEYIDDVENGLIQKRTAYHSNGAPKAITSYENGVPQGERRTYFPGGEPATIEQWRNGCQHGPTEVYENGEKSALVPYLDGQKHGYEQRYREDGTTVYQQVSWIKGTQHGPTYTYVGDTKNTDWYYQGRQVNKQTFDAMRNKEAPF